MATSILNLHSGGSIVSREELALIEIPPATQTWHPVKHVDVLDSVTSTLEGAGYTIEKQSLALSHHGNRFFATLDLSTQITSGISLAVGVRNSQDKSFPIGFCAGNRVFCCSNLSFHSDITIARKHSRFGNQRYVEALAKAVSALPSYQASATSWISRLTQWTLSPEMADSIILRAYEMDLIGARMLPDLIKEVRHPEFPEFDPNTAWGLWNCFTTCLRKTQETQPAVNALRTIRLQRLFEPPKEIIDVEFHKTQAAV